MEPACKDLQEEFDRLAVTPRQVHTTHWHRKLRWCQFMLLVQILIGMGLLSWLTLMVGWALAGQNVRGEVLRAWTSKSRHTLYHHIQYSFALPDGRHVDSADVSERYYSSLPKDVTETKTPPLGPEKTSGVAVAVRALNLGGWCWSLPLEDDSQAYLSRAYFYLPLMVTAVWLAGYGFLVQIFWVRPRRDLYLAREGRAAMGEVLSVTPTKIRYSFRDASGNEILGSVPAPAVSSVQSGAAIVLYDQRNPGCNVLLNAAYYRPAVCSATTM